MILLILLNAAFAAQDVNLASADGTRIHALASPVKGSKQGVVLVHMAGREASDWSYMADKLARNGLQVIAPDLRGHGKSVKAGGGDLVEADYQAMTQDVDAAVVWLRAQGAAEISCMGASIGANLCAQMAAKDPDIQNLVLLSPGLNYLGVTSAEAVVAYGDRPLMIVASTDDAYSARSATLLEQRAVGPTQYLLLENAGHGSKMLNRDSTLENTVTSWLMGGFKVVSGQGATLRPDIDSSPGTVETTGTKLESHR